MTKSKTFYIRLKGRLWLTSEVLHLRFETISETSFLFKAGQHVCLSKEVSGRTLKSYYSLASEPKPGRVELCVKAKKNGTSMSHFLAQCKLEESFDVDPPGGNFLLRTPLRTSVFVVHGTGIAPVRSMLQFLFNRKQSLTTGSLFTLLQGARTVRDLHYYDEFKEFEHRYQQFRFWPVLSQTRKDWSGRVGYAQDHIAEALRGGFDSSDVYLCGCREMVESTAERLTNQGFDNRAIVYERYG